MDIKSTLKKYPGYIVLPEYLTPQQMFAIEDCQFDARDYWEQNTVKDEKDELQPGKRFSFLRYRASYLPAVLLCVKEWHLENFSLNGNGAKYDEFPMSPATDIGELLQWVWLELTKLYNGDNIPNE